jgi:hypothetical protein
LEKWPIYIQYQCVTAPSYTLTRLTRNRRFHHAARTNRYRDLSVRDLRQVASFSDSLSTDNRVSGLDVIGEAAEIDSGLPV